MKSIAVRNDAWERDEPERSIFRPGCLHALRVRWAKTGYPAGLYMLALTTVPVLMILPAFLLVVYADKLEIW